MTPEQRAAEVRAYAEERGWICATVPLTDDTPGIYLYGERGGYGFACSWSINPATGRTVVLRLDGNPRAGFVVTDGKHEWHGPASAYRHALRGSRRVDGIPGCLVPEPQSKSLRRQRGVRFSVGVALRLPQLARALANWAARRRA